MSSFKNEKFINLLKFLKLLRVEPYLFLVMFQHALKHMPAHQLLQDKICLDWYNTTEIYCINLPHSRESRSGHGQFKSQILADVAQFGTYHTYISTVPALVWSLFVGAWIDRYIKARKILMIFSVGAAIVENLMTIYLTVNFEMNVYYNLLLHIPSSVFGGHIASRIAITHYMTSTTPPKLMSMRLAFIEMCLFVANPIGTSLSGYLLVQTPVFKTGEIRNYTFIFIIALGFEVLALIWIMFMVDERIARKQELKIEMKIQAMNGQEVRNDEGEIQLKSDMSSEDKTRHPLRLLFNLENIKLMFKTCTKKRPNKARTQLFMVFAAMTLGHIAVHGGGHIAHQFIQKIYSWKLDWTSYVHSLNMVIHSIATLTIVPFMIKVMEVSDVCLAIIGFLTYFTRNLLMGTWLNPNALYISLAITSIGGVSLIGSRSHMTKIVERDEIGKVMSFLSVLDTLSPMFSTTLFAYIFMFTIDTYPGLVYQITALLLLFPITMFMWIDVYTYKPLMEKKKNDKAETETNQQDNNRMSTII